MKQLRQWLKKILRRYKLLGTVFLSIYIISSSALCYAWAPTEPPVGHIETSQSGSTAFGYFHDRDILLSYQNTITTILGTAHKGYTGLSQANANARVSYYTIEYWIDSNQNWQADAGDSNPTWQTLFMYTMTANGPNVIGFNVPAVSGSDNGSEGNLMQQSNTWTAPGGYYLLRIYVVDVNGNTNMMVGGIDKHALTGTNAYMGENGDTSLGVEDNEIVAFRINRKPGAPTIP